VILLWGDLADRPFASVVLELSRLGAAFVTLTPRELEDAEVRLSVGGGLDGELRVGGRAYPLAGFAAAYLRPIEPESVAPGTRLPTARLVAALLAWADVAPVRVVNRPSAMAANDSKPFQARQIRAAGFATPATLITTSPEAVREFRRRGPLIYKSISGVRSIVSRLGPEQEAYLGDVTHCPTMFQEYVPGVDHRVHVVGDELFSCRVVSSADDYRYPRAGDERTRIEAVELDTTVAARIRGMVRAMDMSLAGVDLRRTPEGRWYCFEVNPSPAFSYFAQATGQPIAYAIARLLAG
jgi:glutathione synthase/RimK-type ligase-like ATP-grasp enzyme